MGCTMFLDICKIVNKKPANQKRKNERLKDRLEPISKEQMLDLLNNKFYTLNELQQRNVKTYLQNNIMQCIR